MPQLFFTPLSDADIPGSMPPPQGYIGEPCFFSPQDVHNLDGSGAEPDPELTGVKRIRVPVLWDEDAITTTGTDPQDGTSPLGYAWKHEDLFQRAAVAHGIDVGTADHLSGVVSIMSGIAGPKYRSPALGAFVAHAFSERYPHRPLQNVAIGQGPTAAPVTLGPAAMPTRIMSAASLEHTLSERHGAAWEGLRDRSAHPQYGFDSSPMADPIETNAIEEHVLARTRRLHGTVNAGTSAFYEQLYDTYGSVSKLLALDLVTTLEATIGWEHFTPSWANPMGTLPPYGMTFGYANGSDTGATWNEQFDLALRLLKADLASAISIKAQGMSSWYFDSHDGGEGYQKQFLQNRVLLEAVGRLLHEMQSTEIAAGRTLLDDTLVVICSEFSRTWAIGGSGACDHWPYTSVVFAGGGVRGNRQIGSFDITAGGRGVPIPLTSEGGDAIERVPRSADVIWTALHLLGIEDAFIPGGVAEITGVRA